MVCNHIVGTVGDHPDDVGWPSLSWRVTSLWMVGYPLMVDMCQEQNPIMNLVVVFLKMLALYVLWRAHFLSEFYAIFCVHQILISLPL